MRRIVEILKHDTLVIVVGALYVWAAIASPERAVAALVAAVANLASVALIIISVFLALGLFSVLIDKQAIGRRLGEGSGLGAMLLAAGFGTILVGPVYAIFPLLKAFREHGARWSLIVTVLTAWAVKIPMIPLELRFMGWQFSVSRIVLTLAAALLMGPLVEMLLGREAKSTTSGEPAAAAVPAGAHGAAMLEPRPESLDA